MPRARQSKSIAPRQSMRPSGRAGPRDVVLLPPANENYQEAGGVRRPFSDVETAAAALAARTTTAGGGQ